VFLSHAGLKGKVPGYFGLSVFFFLSGLFDPRRCCAWSSTGSRDISLKQFYLRRVFPHLSAVPILVLLAAYLLTALGAWNGSLGARLSGPALHLTNYYIIQQAGGRAGSRHLGVLVPGGRGALLSGVPAVYLWLRRRGLNGREKPSP